MGFFRIGFVLVGALAAVGSAGAAGPTAGELRALLVTAHVPLTRGATPSVSSFPAAWTAFQRFAGSDAQNAELEFGFGVFESHFWGTSFEVELTSGQVHLVVHFPVAAYIAITRNLRATPCLPGDGCAFRCFFTGDDGLVPRPCRVTPDGYPVGDMTLSGRDAAVWSRAVRTSPVFRALLVRHVRPDGYELWAE